MEPESTPTKNLQAASTAADTIADREAFCFISIVLRIVYYNVTCVALYLRVDAHSLRIIDRPSFLIRGRWVRGW
jgi:hypothetical protein